MKYRLIALTLGWWGFASYHLAVETNPSGDWISYILNGGPFAIVVFLLVKDYLTTPYERNRLRIENDALRAEIKALNENVRQEIVPSVVKMNELMGQVVTHLDQTTGGRRRST